MNIVYLMRDEKKGFCLFKVRSKMDNKKTKWFRVEYTDPFYKELSDLGLQAFKQGKNRKTKKLNGVQQLHSKKIK